MRGIRRAIVTGGAGFVGSHLVDRLVDEGIETISIDDYVAGKHENLAHLAGNSLFTEVDCDITDYDALAPYFEGVDTVFHQAASKKTICLRDPRRDLEINAKGAWNLLELARTTGVEKFVHASTGSVYGEAVTLPQSEDHPLNPTSFYGVSKLAGERYCGVFSEIYGMDTTVLRYFHVYGPRQESSDVGGVVSIFARRALAGDDLVIFGDGTQERSFTSVHDVVEANYRAATMGESRNRVYNCASGIKVTIKQLADMVLKHFGREDLEIRFEDWTPGDILKFDIDNSRIRAELGIEFVTDFHKGLVDTLEWSRNYFGMEVG